MKLAYEAFDRSGKVVREVIESPSPEEATDLLRRQGLYVTSMKRAGSEAVGSGDAPRKRGRKGGSGKRLKSLAMFSRQLYVLLSTGTQMVESLGALERQTRDPYWREVIIDLRKHVEQGKALSDAMEEHPECFDAVYRSLIRAGESGGKFEPILDRLAQLTRKQMQMRNALTGAMVYPALLLVVSVVVLVSMLVFVLPRFTVLFETLKLPLPPTTKVMIFISNFLINYWWAIVPSLIVSVVGFVYWVKTPSGRAAVDVAMIKTPILRDVTRSFITARIIRLLGVLSDSYVPLLEALDLAKEAANHAAYRNLISQAQDAVSRGEPISSAFRDTPLISPTVYEAIRSGEQTGKVSSLMLNMADFLDDENEVVLKSATSLLEPVILVVLGVLVGLVAISMFMPLFDLTAQAGAA